LANRLTPQPEDPHTDLEWPIHLFRRKLQSLRWEALKELRELAIILLNVAHWLHGFRMSGETQILVFSDFPSEGEVIEQTLREISGRAVQAVLDEETALQTLGAHTPEIVFAHLRAGAVASTSFLNEVWTRKPQTTRFLLGDSTADSDVLVRCALGPHQFIPGPINPEKLDAALARADSIKRIVNNEKIRSLVSRMRTLPSRPALSIEVMRELRSAKASASAVGELVSKDLAISTKLIQVANSAFYSAEQKVSTPAEAVLLLGLESTAALVLSIETFTKLDKLKPLYFSMDRVWKHSQSVAELARNICQLMGADAETSAHAYTAGLLHDIGKLALAQNFEEDYARILKETEEKALPLHRVEEEFFGVTHAETGAYLLALWGLPQPIVEAVAGHHLAPDRVGPEFSGGIALHFADRLTNAPAKFKEIIASYPRALGLAPHAERLRALLGTPKTRPGEPTESPGASPVAVANPSNATAPSALPAESPREPAKISAATPGSRRRLYILSGALATLLAVLGFFFWLRTTPIVKARAQAHPKRVVKPLPEQPEAAENKREQAANNDVATTSEQSLLFDQPLSSDQPPFTLDELFSPEQAPTPEQPELEPKTVNSQPPLEHPGRLSSKLNLQALMYVGVHSSVVINGVLLHLGDSIEGWQVLSIREQDVTLQNGTDQRTLGLR
jgi:putative nucleotidyltransferase with HDIG domain